MSVVHINASDDGEKKKVGGIRSVATDDNLFVSSCPYWDTYSYNLDRIKKFDLHGDFIMDIGSYGTGMGQLRDAGAITALKESDGQTYLYIIDSGNHRVQKFNASNGNYVNAWSLEVGSYYIGIAASLESDVPYLYLTVPNFQLDNGRIVKLNTVTSTAVTLVNCNYEPIYINLTQDASGTFFYCNNIKYDSNGNTVGSGDGFLMINVDGEIYTFKSENGNIVKYNANNEPVATIGCWSWYGIQSLGNIAANGDSTYVLCSMDTIDTVIQLIEFSYNWTVRLIQEEETIYNSVNGYKQTRTRYEYDDYGMLSVLPHESRCNYTDLCQEESNNGQFEYYSCCKAYRRQGTYI
jgi:hypothetical protein